MVHESKTIQMVYLETLKSKYKFLNYHETNVGHTGIRIALQVVKYKYIDLFDHNTFANEDSRNFKKTFQTSGIGRQLQDLCHPNPSGP